MPVKEIVGFFGNSFYGFKTHILFPKMSKYFNHLFLFNHSSLRYLNIFQALYGLNTMPISSKEQKKTLSLFLPIKLRGKKYILRIDIWCPV
jgi:hypothetical protein